MKRFIVNNLLFNKSSGLMGYFWLLALALFSVPLVMSINMYPKWIAIILLLIFAKLYRDSYYYSKYEFLKIIIELIIVLIVGIASQNPILFIYIAWQIGSMNLSKKKFAVYTTLFLLVCAVSIGYSIYTSKSTSVYEIIYTTFFAIGSPFIARSLKNSYLRRASLSQNNDRLETIIKQAERGRIAKDLHDNLGQSFSLITLKAELAEKLMSKDQEKAAKELQDIAETSRQDLNLVRQIVADLNKQTIAEVMTIEEKNLKTANIFMHTENESSSVNWPDSVQNTLAAIIKESVTNMIRYSKASMSEFNFDETADSYQLKISDNGVGIQDKRDNSFGIKGMDQRVKSLKGTISIASNNGTVLNISIPKETNND
ncbi:sensor histidine kinase [Companilactobacillus mishanensis]|uniref:sensor histidine kinase n=1 Tax=Companilactobacillus mishanensis TaxID=2486008 RepID=UPI001297FE31|nr:sensor histidine kinase [Companilactobacillus mishanensis]MQS90167.1 sensor histidine kinase [Companilactobacillus mishanensis]